jgi:hypothetical protein
MVKLYKSGKDLSFTKGRREEAYPQQGEVIVW